MTALDRVRVLCLQERIAVKATNQLLTAVLWLSWCVLVCRQPAVSGGRARSGGAGRKKQAAAASGRPTAADVGEDKQRTVKDFFGVVKVRGGAHVLLTASIDRQLVHWYAVSTLRPMCSVWRPVLLSLLACEFWLPLAL